MKKQLSIIGVITMSVLGFIYFFQKKTEENLFKVMEIPDFEMTNQNNETISPKDLLGKVYLVEFFFTNCPTICPIMNQNLLKINNEINHPDFGVLSITIDPKRDTPETLNKYRNQLEIQNPNWHFLTAERDSIFSVSKKFNIYIGEDYESAEGLEHSGKFALVDKNGKIRSRFNKNGLPLLYYSGLNYSDEEGENESLNGKYHPEIDALKQDIKILLNE